LAARNLKSGTASRCCPEPAGLETELQAGAAARCVF
jgi:hypothetical protein